MCHVNSEAEVSSFVGDDYYCESSNHGFATFRAWIVYGMEMSVRSCPWFMKTLSASTSDDIEIQLCGLVSLDYFGDTPVQLLELKNYYYYSNFRDFINNNYIFNNNSLCSLIPSFI